MLSKMQNLLKNRGAVIKLSISALCIICSVVFVIPLSSLTAKGCAFIINTVAANREFISKTSFEDVQDTTAATENEEEPISAETTGATEASEAETTTESAEISTSGAYSTPDDILRLEEEYIARFASAVPYGTTEEVFFKTSGSTHSVEGIYIKNATAEKNPDFTALLKEGPVLSIEDKSEPVVLIFHTHTTESYLLTDNGVFYEDYQTRSTDNTRNMVRVGEEICRVLKENGIGYIHDTKIYDESYDGAYSRSRVSVESYLEQYPTIQIVLDVHRDAIHYSDTSHCKPTAVINDKKAAQIMIITGAEEGYITNFPHWEDNLKFALCLQKTAEDMYPGLMKPIFFCQRKYNMDSSKCSLLLEMGTDANTLDEALYSGFLTGNVLARIINDYSEDEI